MGWRDREDEDDETVEIRKALVVAETQKAVRVSAPGWEEPKWVPKSVITDDSEVYDESQDGCGPGKLAVKKWWADKEGIEDA
jgi:hypothetical protein